MLLIMLTEKIDYDLATAVEAANTNLDWGGGDGETMWLKFLDDNELPETEYPGPTTVLDGEFNAWFADHVEWIADSLLYNLERKLVRRMIPVFREITAPEEWLRRIGDQPLGVFWSWDQSAAEAHWGSGDGADWLISGLVSPSRIAWEATIGANVSMEGEKEIYVNEGSPIEIVGLWMGDKYNGTRQSVDISHLPKRIFPA